MDNKLECYPFYKKLADRYRLDLDNLKIIHTLAEATNGYCVLVCEENDYAHAYQDRALIAEGEDTEIYDFLMLRLFLDKYRTGKYPLPELIELRVVGQSEEDAIEENRKIMEIMLRPLDTYEDLLDRFGEAEARLNLNIKNLETFNGYASQKKTLNGGHPDWEHPDYRVYKRVREGVWTISSAVERGNGRLELLMWIYGRQYLHEYILNNHLGAVL